METHRIIEKRAEVKKVKEKTSKQKIELAEINKLAKKMIREDIRTYKIKIIQEELNKNCSIKAINRNLKNGKPWIMALQNSHGNNIRNRSLLIEEASKFYSELYASKMEQHEDVSPSLSSVSPVSTNPSKRSRSRH